MMRFIRWFALFFLLAFMWGDIWDSHTATTSQITALQKSVDSLSRCSSELLLRVKLMDERERDQLKRRKGYGWGE